MLVCQYVEFKQTKINWEERDKELKNYAINIENDGIIRML